MPTKAAESGKDEEESQRNVTQHNIRLCQKLDNASFLTLDRIAY